MRKAADFIHETGQLKRVKRTGWWMAGIDNPESVADHSFRAGVIAYVLGKKEGIEPEKAGFMALINDLQEARLNDLHKVGHKYIDFKKAEASAIRDQLLGIGDTGKDMLESFEQFHNDGSKEGVVAKDADLLECAFQAREYMHFGYPDLQGWIDNVASHLKTESARELLDGMKNTDPSQWWQGLKKTER
ncbi:MAG: HD domain-containing protein [Nanobdellota archaeon]